MNPESINSIILKPEDPAEFRDFDFEGWLRELLVRGREEGYMQFEMIASPIPNGPSLCVSTIEEILEALNLAGVYVGSDATPMMASMGLIHFNSNDCLISLSYTCSLKWEELQETDNPEVRHCTQCAKNVYHIKSGSDISIAIENSACVAFFK